MTRDWSGRRVAVILMLGVMSVSFIRMNAQVAAPQTAFEAATVRQNPTANAINGFWSLPGIGKFDAKGVSLALLIHLAYGVDDNQISGKPGWLEMDLFDVEAKPEAGVKLSREELKPLLQNLLAQRFHLQTHTETKLMKGYALVVAKGGPKLTPTKSTGSPAFRVHDVPGDLQGIKWSMQDLAKGLQHGAGLPVVDQTGLTGSYDFHLSYAPDITKDSSLPSIFTALQEQMGLKLEEQKVPVDVVVIDHVDRVPTEN